MDTNTDHFTSVSLRVRGKYLSLYYALAYPLEYSNYTVHQINLQSVLVES